MSARRLHDRLLALRLGSTAERHVVLRQQVVDALAAAEADDVVLDMLETDWAAAPGLDEAALAGTPAHLLLAWCDDLEGCSLYLLPVDGGPPLAQLVADARQVRGLCFADASDCPPASLGPAIRLVTAMGRNAASAVYDGWRGEIDHAGGAATVGIGSAADLAPYVHALRDHVLGRAAQLTHRIVEVVSVNKAS